MLSVEGGKENLKEERKLDVIVMNSERTMACNAFSIRRIIGGRIGMLWAEKDASWQSAARVHISRRERERESCTRIRRTTRWNEEILSL